MHNMRILLATGIYPPELGGPATYSRACARALIREGHEVVVVTYGESFVSTDLALKEAFPVERVSRAGGPVVRYMRFFLHTWSLLQGVDLAYVQGAVSEGLPTTLAARLRGIPTIMRVPGDYAWEMASSRGSRESLDEFIEHRHMGLIRFYEWVERWTARSARYVITPSAYLQTIARRWGVAEGRIRVILNAVASFTLPADREEVRRRLGVKQGDVVCLAVGRAVPWKGVDAIIEWWDRVPSRCMLIVAGEGPELARWKKLAEQRPQARIRFVGALPFQEVVAWYGACDVVLLHSGYEGYPHVIAEAASHGIPCLVSDRGGNPETRTQFGDSVTVLPYQNADAWITAITSLSQRSSVLVSRETVPVWTHEQMTRAVLDLFSLCVS